MLKSRKVLYSLAAVLFIACICNIIFLLATGDNKSGSVAYAVTPDTLKSASKAESAIVSGGTSVYTVEQYARLTPKISYNDRYFGEQWALARIQHLPFYTSGATRIVPTIAVLDTGIDGFHYDLKGRVLDEVNFSGSITKSDLNGHGTHIAGIIAAIRDNDLGIVGALDNARLLNVKVAEDSGIVWSSSITRGIKWATDHGAQVINMSLATTAPSAELEQAVKYAWEKGVVLVAAVGNYSGTVVYPAACPEVIGVAALTPDGIVWQGSNDGDFVKAYAPGVNIISTLPDLKCDYMSGSSMAAAYASAVAALLLDSAEDDNGNGRVNDEVMGAVQKYLHRPE